MKWASAFKYLPINYDETICTSRELTQRVSFDNNLDGDRIRIHFSNRYGKKKLRLDRVTVGCVKGEAVDHPIPVTLGGEPVITLEPGQVIFSDEDPFTVHAGERLVVNIHIDEPQFIESVCLVN